MLLNWITIRIWTKKHEPNGENVTLTYFTRYLKSTTHYYFDVESTSFCADVFSCSLSRPVESETFSCVQGWLLYVSFTESWCKYENSFRFFLKAPHYLLITLKQLTVYQTRVLRQACIVSFRTSTVCIYLGLGRQCMSSEASCIHFFLLVTKISRLVSSG